MRLKTMLVMTGMDHLIEMMDEQQRARSEKAGPSNNGDALPLGIESSASDSETLERLFSNLLRRFDAIEEKLQSIQTAHFALQHSCSSANEVAQMALQNYQRGNPYLSQIDTILSHQNEADVTDNIIASASEMISVARRDTENFIHSLQQQSVTPASV